MGLFSGIGKAFNHQNLGHTLGILGGGLGGLVGGGMVGGGGGAVGGGLLGLQLSRLLGGGMSPGMRDVHNAVGALPPDSAQPETPVATGRPMPNSFSEIMDQLRQMQAQRGHMWGLGKFQQYGNPPNMGG